MKNEFTFFKSLTYDAINDTFYFVARYHPTTSIFSLKINNKNFTTTPLVDRAENEYIEDLTYDFHDQALYWSDSGNKKIVKLTFDRSDSTKWSTRTFLNVTQDVKGLEIDSCRRNLYYSMIKVGQTGIGVISLDHNGTKPTLFGAGNHNKPTALAIDHYQRRLYVADVGESNSYSIDSYLADGTDFRNELKKPVKTPRSIALDSENVYYVEGNDHNLRRFKKFGDGKVSETFKVFQDDPSDLIVRSNFITDLNSGLCKLPPILKPVEEKKNVVVEQTPKKEVPNKFCLHGGTLDGATSSCRCSEDYDGDSCEISLCYNFCLNNGQCSMNRDSMTNRLEPKCSCLHEFGGKRCEVKVCPDNFCLNNGKCIEDASDGFNKKPKCICDEKNFSGVRCEISKVETRPVIINTNSEVKVTTTPTTTTTTANPTSKVPEPSEDRETSHVIISENLASSGEEQRRTNFERCENSLVTSNAIIAVCVLTSLLIFLIILLVIKRFNRPMRPMIRKKYVVHKNIEPMTYRPTTERCEVIIEDCCNMNICETVSACH